MFDKSTKLLEIIRVDLYNKKIIVEAEDLSVITLKCGSINELIELLDQCKKLIKTENVIQNKEEQYVYERSEQRGDCQKSQNYFFADCRLLRRPTLRCERLLDLNLSSCTALSAEDIQTVLHHCPQLHVLRLGGCRGLGTLPLASPSLRELHLGWSTSLEGFRLPYITITPTFSVCPTHGYIDGEYEFCPKCDEELIAKKRAAVCCD